MNACYDVPCMGSGAVMRLYSFVDSGTMQVVYLLTSVLICLLSFSGWML